MLQVEKVFGASHLDSMEIEKAKNVLKVVILRHLDKHTIFKLFYVGFNSFAFGFINAGA